MKEYHKIQTVFLRDPETNYKVLLEGEFAKPEFELLQDVPWEFTEKIDGTNIRVIFDGDTCRYGGKTDNAQMPVRLYEKLVELLPSPKLKECFDGPATLYGEGYGAKIQKGGGNYIPNGCSFCLFDVFCGGMWLERSNVEDIAIKLGLSFAPIVHTGPLLEGVEMVREGIKSTFGNFQSEGFVMRPHLELLDRRGERIISKIKCKDFPK